ncbi:hypothetical protein [Ruegeria lacuscaerulensis]|uniref:hypothetical protein n=1 Tax=Ruegeria lacuscaerulensis TaxID=55218 RepID=UPI00147CF2F8|nr:hypothetical protein [Ruegeria lacuscaerulensis]
MSVRNVVELDHADSDLPAELQATYRNVPALSHETHSGGVCINDVVTQVTVDDIPFGGVRSSWVGYCHGKEKGPSFSNANDVVREGKLDGNTFVGSSWDSKTFKLLVKFHLRRFRNLEPAELAPILCASLRSLPNRAEGRATQKLVANGR